MIKTGRLSSRTLAAALAMALTLHPFGLAFAGNTLLEAPATHSPVLAPSNLGGIPTLPLNLTQIKTAAAQNVAASLSVAAPAALKAQSAREGLTKAVTTIGRTAPNNVQAVSQTQATLYDGQLKLAGDSPKDAPIVQGSQGGESGANSGGGGDNSGGRRTPQFKSSLPARAYIIESEAVWGPNITLRHTTHNSGDIANLKAALAEGGYVVVTSPRPYPEGGTGNDHFPVAALAKILAIEQTSDQGATVALKTLRSAVITGYSQDKAQLKYPQMAPRNHAAETYYAEHIKEAVEGMTPNDAHFNPELAAAAASISDHAELAQALMLHFEFSDDPHEDLRKKQDLLAAFSIEKQLKTFAAMLMGTVQVSPELDHATKEIMEKSQREYYLRTQIEAANKLLGNDKDADVDRLDAALARKRGGMSAEAVKAAESELNKARGMSNSKGPEYWVSVNYVDRLLSLPWGVVTPENGDLKKAEEILNADHHGLDEIKERVMEYLAIRKLAPSGKAPILAFDGPPGVGKTSLGKSIARSLGLVFQRISLGGVRDEAEIRGHRRTYIGALYGKITDALIKAGVDNPVIQLDEIDKMRSDEKGDPAAAMLEVLDPEQNHAFKDHYMDVSYDLSKVFFLATSNVRSNIPAPLQDRMEIVQLGSYTDTQKQAIAQGYLVPKQAEANAIPKGKVSITPQAVLAIIRGYTREGGVRNLEREIGKIMRKAATRKVRGSAEIPASIDAADLEGYLGPGHFEPDADANGVGQATGLAVSGAGGDVLAIETLAMPKGTTGVGFNVTGQLKDVMQESSKLSFIRAKLWAAAHGVPMETLNDYEYSLHVPDGATPKDGPSAGITMLTALASRMTGRAVRQHVAMTGELTLSGKVKAIGGLQEKSLAALRLGYKEIIISKENEGDLKKLPQEVLDGIKFHIVTTGDQVLEIALEKNGTPLPAPAKAEKTAQE